RDALLAQMPFESHQLDSSNFRIMSAYYETARIYENDLLSPVSAIHHYEALMDRCLGNRHVPAVSYRLYVLYESTDPERALVFRYLILNEYPESDYALVINNPSSVLARREQTDAELNRFYEETYQLFSEGQYAEVISRAQAPEVNRGSPEMAARFALLQALA